VVLLHAVERGVERAFFDAEELTGDALYVEDDAVAVEGGVLREGLEDEELECALEVVFSHRVLCLEV
jgi:hypothetical protein